MSSSVPPAPNGQPHTTAIVMAAGLGTRMKSALPKALHRIAGRPLVHYPVRAALEAGCDEVIVVVGHGRAEVAAYLVAAFGDRVRIAVQEQQAGTGDAARAGVAVASETTARVLVLNGDTPLVTAEDLAPVLAALGPDVAMTLASCEVPNPQGYGRILRDDQGHVLAIREQKDTRSDEERAVREINPGIYCASLAFLRDALGSLTPNNAQGEYYLTDIVFYGASRGGRVVAVASRAEVMEGVNDREQLAQAERVMYARINRALRLSGVTVRDGARVDDGVEVMPDSTLEAGVVLRGETRIGAGAIVDVGCVLTHVVVESGARLRPYTVAESARIGTGAQVGPFSHLRPDSVLGPDVHVGNFVETKKTTLGRGSKANHLAYLGDGIVGEGVNVGDGTIFCNYDGVRKHTTTLEDGVFVGSDSHLVAPVTVGKGAYIATGTTVTRDVPAGALAISRTKQENKEGYATRIRERAAHAKAAKIGGVSTTVKEGK